MAYVCCQCGKLSKKSDLVIVPKNAETLRNWIQDNGLRLTITKKGAENYLCKVHLSEEKVTEKLSNITSPAEQSTSDTFVYEVKQEEPYEETEQLMESWKEPKNEPVEEVDYDDLSFEMEPNSYGMYDESSSYQECSYETDCQPTTSTASTSSDSLQNGDSRITESSVDPSNLETFYPELSDNQIFSFCVKASSNISGVTSFECGMCSEEYFNYTDTRPIRHHLRERHSIMMNDFLRNGRASGAPKNYSPMPLTKKVQADEALCRFLIKNGLPLRAVQDRNLEMLAFNMNSEYSLPAVDTLYECLHEIAAARTNSIVQAEDGPITVTFDTTTFNNRNYLAFTVHFYQNKYQRKRCIFLREFDMTEPIVSSIMTAIKNTMDESGIRYQITTVVTGKAEYEDALEDMNCFKQVMVCFSQNVNKFAEALIEDPVFDGSLKKLRDFVTKFPSNRNTWSRFKAYVVKKRTYGEFPEIDGGHWFTTLDFITKCLHMHRLFSEFVNSNKDINYIDVEDNVNIVYLHSLLNLCKNALKPIADRDLTIADVIPAVADINASLNITTSNQTVIDTVNNLFNRLLLPFVDQSDIHRFALFLHPRLHGSSVLPTSEWLEIKACLARHLSLREATDGSSIKHPGTMSSGLPSFQDTVTVDKEVANFTVYVCRITGAEAGVMDWWSRHAIRFPRLYKYARELFQIPAFSIDASFYLGEYGLLTHSLNETEVSKRQLLLQASSELVEFRSKNDVMCKQICVKRKKDTTCPEDMWYSPIDLRALQACDPRCDVGDNPRRNIPPRRPQMMTLTPIPSKINQTYTSNPNPYMQPTQKSFVPPGRTLKEEISKLNFGPKYQRVYTVATQSPYQRPVIIKKEPIEGIRNIQTAPKKYYAVRTVQQNGQNAVRATNGQLLKVLRTRTPVSHNFPKTNPSAPAISKKVYFIRSKTGITQPLQPPPK